MKKLLAIVLTLALLLVPVLALAEGEERPQTEEEKLSGAWYAQLRGMDLSLTLAADGAYGLSFAGETTEGTWRLTDGMIYLDEGADPALYRVEDKLYWTDLGVYLTREQPVGAYVPGDLLTAGVTADLFNGYWTSLFVEAGGAVLPAYELNDETDVYVEAPKAALGGPIFGDVAVDMTFENAALTWAEGDTAVSLALQSDGLLRLTVSAPDAALTVYLSRVATEPVPEA